MADKTLDELNEVSIFGENDMEEDGTADLIRKAFEGEDDDDDDDGGFDQPLEGKSEEPDVVSPEEGRDLLDDADLAKAKGKKLDGEPTTDKDDAENTDDTTGDSDKAETADDAEGEDEKDPVDLSGADVASLLEGVPDDRKAELTRRFKEADEVLAPFKSPYVQEQMKQFGAKPQDVANRLVDLATFAQQKPDEYLAWAASEMADGPDKVGEVLSAAAKLHGYKLVKDGDEDDEDDMFADEETKSLKARIRELEGQLSGKTGDAPSFGPDTPQRQQARTLQQTIHSFINETDDAGQLRRPYFEQLQPQITQKAAQHRAATGNPVTVEDLDQFYNEAVSEARAAFGAPQTPTPAPQAPSAAQNAPSVADQLKKKADAALRAQRASKSVDGTGQGASRRPALSDDASLDDAIRHFAGLS